jgi:Spy/CpxP family protein refolding chaperone
MTTLASLGQVRLRAILLLAAMFLAGALSGAGLALVAGPRHHRPPRGLSPFGELDLSAAQQARAKEIFERHRPELDAVVRETMPRVHAIQDTIDKEMEAVLTPDQARRLKETKAWLPPPPPGLLGMGPPPEGPPPGAPPPGAP